MGTRALTMREFDLLAYMMRHSGVVPSREKLLQNVWGWDFSGGSRTVDMHVLTLRQKLGEHADAWRRCVGSVIAWWVRARAIRLWNNEVQA